MPQGPKIAICPGLSLADYIIYCCTGRLPASIIAVQKKSPFLDDLVCLAQLLGALEPLCATRPGVCDPVVVVDRDFCVEPATLNAQGQVAPSEARGISLCAPMNRALVIKTLRITAANLTAAESGEVEFKKVNLGTFGEFCLPFEPLGGPGNLVNVEHIIAPPGAGFSVHAKNHDRFSEACFHVHAEMWACC